MEALLMVFWKILVILVAVVAHEVAHGYAALYEGDPTAKRAGRLTLNPIAHIDPFMSVILPGLLILSGSSIIFGAAKPVPVNPWYFRHGKWGDVIVSAAGAGANLVLAALFGFLAKISGPFLGPFFYQATLLNVVLAVFNLLPIPPLDGFRIISPFLPESIQRTMEEIERYGILILFVLLFFFGRYFWGLIGPVISFLMNVFM